MTPTLVFRTRNPRPAYHGRLLATNRGSPLYVRDCMRTRFRLRFPGPAGQCRSLCRSRNRFASQPRPARSRRRPRECGHAADAAILLAAARPARRRRGLGQAREPHAGRRLQGARRTRLSRRPAARSSPGRRRHRGHPRQSRPVVAFAARRAGLRGGHRRAPRQQRREERRHAGARRRADRARPRFPGRLRARQRPRARARCMRAARSIPTLVPASRAMPSSCSAPCPISTRSTCRSAWAPASAGSLRRARPSACKTEIVGVVAENAPPMLSPLPRSGRSDQPRRHHRRRHGLPRARRGRPRLHLRAPSVSLP